MEMEQYLDQYQNFIFEFDNVLYPEKDYFLQAYYLFAQFIEYTEQRNAAEILDFMKASYERDGREGLFDRTSLHFNIDEKYRVNFDLLMQNVKLPLKLLLFDNMLRFLALIAKSNKRIYLLVTGDPIMALNKIRQTEWNHLAGYLTLYFSEELGGNSLEENLALIVNRLSLDPDKVLFVSHLNTEVLTTSSGTVFNLDAAKLLDS